MSDTYGNMLIEGMNILKEDKEKEKNSEKQAEMKQKKDDESDDTLSNTSTISNSTTKTIQFTTSADEGNELTFESCIQGMREQTSRYNITYQEAMEWINEYHDENEKLMKAEDIDDIHEHIGLGAWKELKKGILAKRKYQEIRRRAEKRKQKQKGNGNNNTLADYEKPDPKLDEAISKMDIDIPRVIQQGECSASQSTNQISQVSRLTNEEPSQNTRDIAGEGGRR